MTCCEIITGSLTILVLLVMLVETILIIFLHWTIVTRNKQVSTLLRENKRLAKEIIASVVNREYY
jgi:hypothetical protein